MNLLIDTDHNFILPTATMLYSLRTNLQEDEKLVVYLGYYKELKLQDNQILLLKSMLSVHDEIITVECDHNDPRPKGDRWSEQVLLKILSIYKLPNNIDRVLHIDGDVIINGDIMPFYNIDLKNNVIAGSGDLVTKMKPCAGVMLFDTKKFLANLPTESDFYNEFKKIKGIRSEEEFLQTFFQNKTLIMNDTTYMHFCDRNWPHNMEYQSKKPIIYHYAGLYKPWKWRTSTSYTLLFWKYAKHIYKKKDYYKFLILHPIYLILKKTKTILNKNQKV